MRVNQIVTHCRIHEIEEQNEEFVGPAESYSFEVRVETNPKLVGFSLFISFNIILL